MESKLSQALQSALRLNAKDTENINNHIEWEQVKATTLVMEPIADRNLETEIDSEGNFAAARNSRSRQINTG